MSTINKIFYLLKKKGYKQKDLTDYLGINKSVATQWRKGTSDSYTKYLTKIAEFLGVKGGELIEDVEYDELVISSIDSKTKEIEDKESTPLNNERGAAMDFVKDLSDSDFARYCSIIKAIFPDKFKE